MICLDCRQSPALICDAHKRTHNHDPEVDFQLMVIDLRRENERLRKALEQLVFLGTGIDASWRASVMGELASNALRGEVEG